MIRRIDHIAIAVRDIDRARRFFLEGLGGRQLWSEPLESAGLHWSTVELGSSCLLELIHPLDEEGFLHRFLASRGEGAHHITMQVDDIEAARRRLEERGIPYFGFGEPLPGWKELFIHPRDAFGILLQFAEFDPLNWTEGTEVPAPYREFVKSPSDVLLLGDPRLRQQAARVEDVRNPPFQRQVERLQAVLAEVRSHLGFGRAIAAPQIGVPLRVIALDPGVGPGTIINPEITAQSEETFLRWDDCLSFPWLLVKVRRHASISLRYQDLDGRSQEWVDLDRAEAELLQHEIDHLDGVLAVDRAVDRDSLVAREVFEDQRDLFAKQVDGP